MFDILKKYPTKYLILFLGTVLFICCNFESGDKTSDEESTRTKVSPMERLADNKAGNIVRKAIEQAGGWEQWTTKKTLSYTKVMTYFDSTGIVEREVRQVHQYQLRPQLKVRISWEENGDKYTIINNGQQAWKLKNGQQLTKQSDINHAWNSSFGAHYVMCMPFKLTDPGTVLTYEGLDTISNGKVIHSIKTTYKEGAGSSAGYHTWWYYFDRADYSLIANFLDYGDGFSYTQYETFIEQQGIKLNKVRQSYRTNADRDLKYVRTVYKNKVLQFDVELEDTLFEPLH